MRLLLLSLVSCLSLYAASITGSVVGVTDGDTITVLDADKVQHKIRLYGIDAPESTQDYGQRSKQLLSALVYGDTVRVDYDDKDRYGRIVGKVYNGEQYVNAEMIRLGLAWHYKQYSKDKDLAELEATAKAGKIGLWSRPDAVAPWDFRRTPKIPETKTEQKKAKEVPATEIYWVTKSSGKVHNSSCRYFKNSNGSETSKPTGSNCKICGGKK